MSVSGYTYYEFLTYDKKTAAEIFSVLDETDCGKTSLTRYKIPVSEGEGSRFTKLKKPVYAAIVHKQYDNSVWCSTVLAEALRKAFGMDENVRDDEVFAKTAALKKTWIECKSDYGEECCLEIWSPDGNKVVSKRWYPSEFVLCEGFINDFLDRELEDYERVGDLRTEFETNNLVWSDGLGFKDLSWKPKKSE